MRQRPRRSFAAPFILTLVAAIPACSKGTTAEEPRPEPGAKPYRTWTVRDSGGVQCSAYLEIDCPPSSEMSCNPPPPAVVDCPARLAPDAQVTLIQLEENGPCTADGQPAECPTWE